MFAVINSKQSTVSGTKNLFQLETKTTLTFSKQYGRECVGQQAWSLKQQFNVIVISKVGSVQCFKRITQFEFNKNQMKSLTACALLLVLAACSIRNLQIQGLGNADRSVIIAFNYVANPGWAASTINFNIVLNSQTVNSFTLDGVNKGKDPRQKEQKFRMVFPVNEGFNTLTFGVGQGLTLSKVFVAQKACCGVGCVTEDANESGIEGDPQVFFPVSAAELNTALEVIIESGCLTSVRLPPPPQPTTKSMTLTFSAYVDTLGNPYSDPNFGVVFNGNTYAIAPLTTSSKAYALTVEAKVGNNNLTFLVKSDITSQALQSAYLDDVSLKDATGNELILNGGFSSTSSWSLCSTCYLTNSQLRFALFSINFGITEQATQIIPLDSNFARVPSP